MLFKVKKDGTYEVYPEALRLTVYLKRLSQKELQCLILWLDYDSKYHQHPYEERRARALKEVFDKATYNLEKNDLIEPAIEEYTALQYSEAREIINTYRRKIASLRRTLNTEEGDKSISSIITSIRNLNEECKKMQRDIDIGDAVIEMRAGGQKSKIEIWQENQREFNRMQEVQKRRKGIAILD